MRTYIWSLPTRIFHWSLVVFMIIVWLSADDDFLQIHSAFGYTITVLIIFSYYGEFLVQSFQPSVTSILKKIKY